MWRMKCMLSTLNREQTKAALLSIRSAPTRRWVEPGSRSRKIQQQHIGALLHSFEDNFAAIWGDVEVVNVEVSGQVG